MVYKGDNRHLKDPWTFGHPVSSLRILDCIFPRNSKTVRGTRAKRRVPRTVLRSEGKRWSVIIIPWLCWFTTRTEAFQKTWHLGQDTSHFGKRGIFGLLFSKMPCFPNNRKGHLAFIQLLLRSSSKKIHTYWAKTQPFPKDPGKDAVQGPHIFWIILDKIPSSHKEQNRQNRGIMVWSLGFHSISVSAFLLRKKLTVIHSSTLFCAKHI